MNTTLVGGGAGDEIVSVPVPRKHFSSVMQYLGRLIETEISTRQLPVESSPEPSPFAFAETNKDEPHFAITWNAPSFQRLRAILKNKAALTALDMTADRPNKAVYVADVMKATGSSHGEVSAGMGALTKAIKKAFGIKHNNFNGPAPFHWDHEQQLAFYMMEPEVADAWKVSESL